LVIIAVKLVEAGVIQVRVGAKRSAGGAEESREGQAIAIDLGNDYVVLAPAHAGAVNKPIGAVAQAAIELLDAGALGWAKLPLQRRRLVARKSRGEELSPHGAVELFRTGFVE
jgi:hypothetical protein